MVSPGGCRRVAVPSGRCRPARRAHRERIRRRACGGLAWRRARRTALARPARAPARRGRADRAGRLRDLGRLGQRGVLGTGLPGTRPCAVGPGRLRPAPRRIASRGAVSSAAHSRRGGRPPVDRPPDPPAQDLRPARAIPEPGGQRASGGDGGGGGGLGPLPSPRVGDRQRRPRRPYRQRLPRIDPTVAERAGPRRQPAVRTSGRGAAADRVDRRRQPGPDRLARGDQPARRPRRSTPPRSSSSSRWPR